MKKTKFRTIREAKHGWVYGSRLLNQIKNDLKESNLDSRNSMIDNQNWRRRVKREAKILFIDFL